MDWKYLFTSFDGRIGRQSWWLGTIALIVVSFVLYFILSPIFGTGMSAMMADPQKMAEPDFMSSLMRRSAFQQIVMLAIIGYPATALMAKRLNDRNRPEWVKWAFWAPTVLSILLLLFGLAYTLTDMGGVMIPTSSSLMSLVGIISLIVFIWALVDLGFLRGTEGPNRFGPDPISE